jgi:hypothetical protein
MDFISNFIIFLLESQNSPVKLSVQLHETVSFLEKRHVPPFLHGLLNMHGLTSVKLNFNFNLVLYSFL